MQRIFITGTAAYGPFTSKSDIDIVMDLKDSQSLENLLLNFGIICKYTNSTNLNYKGFTIHLKNSPTIQVVVTETREDFESWYYATKEMKKIPVIEDKSIRISTFKKLRANYLAD